MKKPCSLIQSMHSRDLRDETARKKLGGRTGCDVDPLRHLTQLYFAAAKAFSDDTVVIPHSLEALAEFK